MSYASFQQRTLANGLRVVVAPSSTSAVVSITIGYHVGSQNEHDGTRGYAHFFEHLMFEGSENVPKGEFDKICSASGGENNAFTTFDKTVYYMKLPADQLEMGLYLESDRMRAYAAGQEAVTAQQGVVIEEIKQNVEDTPYGSISHEMSHAAFAPGSAYFWDVYGSKQDIENATVESAQAFFEEWYVPNNAVLVIAGGVEADYAFSMAEKYFGGIAARDIPAHPHLMQSEKVFGVTKTIPDNIPLSGVIMGWHMPALSEATIKEHAAADVLSSLLGSGMTSRFYKSMVYRDQIASEVGAFHDVRELAALMQCYTIASIPTVTPEQLQDALVREIEAIRTNGVSAKDVQTVVNKFRTGFAGRKLDSTSTGTGIAHYSLFFDEPGLYFNRADRYAEITADDVVNIARTYLQPDEAVVLHYVPKEPLAIS